MRCAPLPHEYPPPPLSHSPRAANQSAIISSILGDFYSHLVAKNVSVGMWGNSNWTNASQWFSVSVKEEELICNT